MTLTNFVAGTGLGVALAAAGIVGGAAAFTTDQTLNALLEQSEIPITIDNFVRVETNIQFERYHNLAGKVNAFAHFRAPTPIDKQLTIRSNRDTLYSFAIIDISDGAEVTLPDAGDRYMSAMVLNQDHYINAIHSGGGTYKLDQATYDTPYVMVLVRTLVDSGDPDDVAAVNALQDRMTIDAKSAKPFVLPNYDEESYQRIFKLLIELGRSAVNSENTFGSKDDVDAVRHLIGTAVGWGGLPESEAVYENIEPGLSVGEYKIEVGEVPVDAFWSVSLYNADGFFQKNRRNAYIVNSVMAARNGDGAVTIHLGGCDDDRVNCLPLMEGWNYTVRLYKPREEILEGRWTFPKARPVD